MTATWNHAALEHLVGQLLTLSRNAHHNLDVDGPSDYWYRLGQRNAYAHAVGLATSRGLGGDAFTVTDLVIKALTDGVQDPAELQRAVAGLTPHGATPAPTLTWVGPRAFETAYGHLPGADEHFGTTWGPQATQRISLRRTPGADAGLLYAYDPLWDEYAVLATHATVDAVRATVEQAKASGNQLSLADFARFPGDNQVTRRQPEAQPSSLTVALS